MRRVVLLLEPLEEGEAALRDAEEGSASADEALEDENDAADASESQEAGEQAGRWSAASLVAAPPLLLLRVPTIRLLGLLLC